MLAHSHVSDTAFLGSFHVLSLVRGPRVLTHPVLRAKACPLPSEPRSVNYRRGVKVSLTSVPSATAFSAPPRPAHPHRPSLPPVSELPEAPRYQFRTALSSLFLPSLLPSLGASVSPDVRPSVFCKQDRAGGSQVPGAHECPLIC